MKGNYSNYRYAFIQQKSISFPEFDKTLAWLTWLDRLGHCRLSGQCRVWWWGHRTPGKDQHDEREGRKEGGLVNRPGGQSGPWWCQYRDDPRQPGLLHRWCCRQREGPAARQTSVSPGDRRSRPRHRHRSGPTPSCSSVSGRSQHCGTPQPGRLTGSLWNKQPQQEDQRRFRQKDLRKHFCVSSHFLQSFLSARVIYLLAKLGEV